MLRGYVQIRNKVFHAQWDAIDVAAVSGIIGFTQGFLTEQSVSPIQQQIARQLRLLKHRNSRTFSLDEKSLLTLKKDNQNERQCDRNTRS